MRQIAALYVETNGVYSELKGVDPWDESRDARLYDGPHPVVAHPPCKRWGRYWSGGPSSAENFRKGDDAGCFAAALWAVRTFGGIIEHPEATHAWGWFGIRKPPVDGGWVNALDGFGLTCRVDQGVYGHRARKATWLYYVGDSMPQDLDWGRSIDNVRIDASYHNAEERAAATPEERAARDGGRLTSAERIDTPIPFRDLMIEIARGAK